MPYKIVLRWANANHHLLPESEVVSWLMVDGSAMNATAASPGRREFDIANVPTTVDVHISFTATFDAFSGPNPEQPGQTINAPARALEVLRVDQSYTVVGGALVPVANPAYQGPHPLIETDKAASGSGVAVLIIHTTFVDVDALYRAYAGTHDYYLSHKDPNVDIFALGYTGGTPLLWLASIPRAARSPSGTRASALVFFRPASYAYNRINQPHSSARLLRYLLAPIPTSPNYWEWDFQDPTRYFYIYCGFDDALLRSNRAMVMLHPRPSGTLYGNAASNMLHSLTAAAMRFLWARRLIYQNRGGVTLGRLGISGFSRGGDGLFSALGGSMSKVDEVYLFDCNGSANNSGRVVQWYDSRDKAPGVTGAPRLRMAGGAYNINLYQSILASIKVLRGKNLVPANVTAAPDSDAMYTSGNNPVWEWVIHLRPELRGFHDSRHQFSVHGGEGSTPGPQLRTYLLWFLQGSQF